MNPVSEVLEKLAAKDFEGLIGLWESVWLEAKESPYILDAPKQKLELAKDVSALANSIGGIIVLGFDTARDSDLLVTTRRALDGTREQFRYREMERELYFNSLCLDYWVFL